MVDLKVKLANITLDNPIIPASGTFGYGYEFQELYDINILGSFACKGTTSEERFGNPLPRIAETDNGLINSVGLQNPGLKKVLNEELPKLKKIYHKKIIANISGFSKEEYIKCASSFDKEDIVGILEINISCPNVEYGGMAFGTDPNIASDIIKEIKKVTTKPIFVKLSPNITDIVEMAKSLEQAGADGLVLVNTFLGLRIDLNSKKPIIANKFGGYSGKGIFPMALNIIYKVYENVKIPIIGCGGVASCDDLLEMMLAGATAVEIGSANLIDPYICKQIIEELPITMKKYKIESLESIIGGAHE